MQTPKFKLFFTVKAMKSKLKGSINTRAFFLLNTQISTTEEGGVIKYFIKCLQQRFFSKLPISFLFSFFFFCILWLHPYICKFLGKGLDLSHSYTSAVAIADPLTHCSRPGIKPFPLQRLSHCSWILSPLCHDRNSPNFNFWKLSLLEFFLQLRTLSSYFFLILV